MSNNMPKEVREFLEEQERSREYFAQAWYQEAMKPSTWAAQAELLRRAAEVLWSAFYQDHQQSVERRKRALPGPASIDMNDLRNLHIFHIYMLIAGYAMENLLKGLIAKKYLIPSWERPHADLPTELPPELKSHNLVDLLEKAGLRCNSNEEREYLKVLSEYATWAGRYFAPRSWRALIPENLLTIHDEPHFVHTMFTTLFNRWFALYFS